VAPATQKGEVGGSWCEAGPSKVSRRSYLKNKLTAKGLGSGGLSGRVLPTMRLDFNPQYKRKKKAK
jgi:hypothetical protein